MSQLNLEIAIRCELQRLWCGRKFQLVSPQLQQEYPLHFRNEPLNGALRWRLNFGSSLWPMLRIGEGVEGGTRERAHGRFLKRLPRERNPQADPSASARETKGSLDEPSPGYAELD
jgi:hypothetical protein